MDSTDILVDGLNRVRDNVHEILDGIDESRLTFAPAPGANTIAWLIWHLTRGQDAQVAALAGTDEMWRSAGWAERFALPFPVEENGHAQSPSEAAQVIATAADLRGYHDDTHRASLDYLKTLSAADLDEVIDSNWDPPVTRGVRLVSIVDDDVQHVGQAAYIRGLDMG